MLCANHKADSLGTSNQNEDSEVGKQITKDPISQVSPAGTIDSDSSC